jgi:hypothetical protein
MQFNADGSGTEKDNISAPDLTLTFTYRISKDSLFFNYPIQTGLPTGNTPTGIIKKLTSNNMVIEYDFGGYNFLGAEHVYLNR